MALATVIISLVVIGALVAAALMVGIQEQRMSESTRWLRKSSGLTEGGVNEVLRAWDAQNTNGMTLYPTAGSTMAVAQTASPSGTGVYGGTVAKLTDQIYLLDMTGRDSSTLNGRNRGDGARQRLGLITRVLPLPVDVQAAMTIGAPVNFGGGNVFVQGTDHVPAGWANCPAAGTPLAGVRAKNAGDANNSQGQMTGTPPVLITPTMDSTTFMQYGTTAYNALAAAATIQLNPGSYAPAPAFVGAVCTPGNTNWGSPLAPNGPCGKRYPVVHVNNFGGTTTLTGGNGQGVLLVDGDLVISGAFTYYGLIIVRGKMSTTAGGSPTVYGALMVQSMNFATTAFAGDANIYYSACALQRTRDAVGSPTLLRSRGWVELL
ncbi:MAG TPA: hypothetical protein VGN76_03720 [Gemmatimonadales bacterium]|jgi:hypothetical protein|nr:hypothetical protein [Gemmatimonadales bacterium]